MHASPSIRLGFGLGVPLIVALASVAAVPERSAAQSPVPHVCTTQPDLASQSACAAKITAYRTWFSGLRAGTEFHSLAPELVAGLEEHFPGIDLADWRFGSAASVGLGSIAATDCSRSYFTVDGLVDMLRTGDGLDGSRASEWLDWAVHQLRHYEQCMSMGGPDAWAFAITNEFESRRLESLFRESAWAEIEARMPMEDDALSTGDRVVSPFMRCCRHPLSGEAVFPIEVDPISVSRDRVKVGELVRAEVVTRNGAQPHYPSWRVRGPGRGGSVAALGEGFEVTWTPEEKGDYTLVVDIRQATPEFTPGMTVAEMPSLSHSITVEPRVPAVTALRPDATRLEPGESTRIRVTATDVARQAEATATVIASGGPLAVPGAVTLAGTGGWLAEGEFEVTADAGELPLLGDRTVTVRAGFNGDPSRTAETRIVVEGYEIQDFRAVPVTDRMGREVTEIRVQLDRRTRVPITLQLSSGDTRTLSPPSTITIRAGASSATLQVAPPSTLRRASSVTVQLSHAHPEFNPRSTSVTVRPRGR